MTAIVGVLLAGAAFSNALGNVGAEAAPAVAAGQVGSSPVIPLLTIDLQALAAADRGQLDQAEHLARRSLERQAINPAALAMLGTVADVRGQPNAASFFIASDRLTRRQPLAEAWLLEYYVAAGSIAKVLRQYDVLLRQQPEFSQTAFPILAAALAEPAVQRDLAPYFDRPTPWLADFTAFAAIQGPAPESLSIMLVNTRRARAAVDLGMPLAELFKKLIETGKARLIPPLFRQIGRWPPELLYRIKLDGNSTDALAFPVTWRLAQNDGADVQILTVENAPAMKVAVSSLSAPQQAVDKVFFLPAKAATLRFTSDVEQDGGGSAEWQVACLSAGPLRLLARSGNLLKRPGPFTLAFEVASDCDAVELILATSGGSDDQDSAITFKKMALQ